MNNIKLDNRKPELLKDGEGRELLSPCRILMSKKNTLKNTSKDASESLRNYKIIIP